MRQGRHVDGHSSFWGFSLSSWSRHEANGETECVERVKPPRRRVALLTTLHIVIGSYIHFADKQLKQAPEALLRKNINTSWSFFATI